MIDNNTFMRAADIKARIKEMEQDRIYEKKLKAVFEVKTVREVYLGIKKLHANEIKKCNDKKMTIFYKMGYTRLFCDLSGYMFMNDLREKFNCNTYVDKDIFRIIC